MGSVTGRNLIISVFGESHGAGLGVNIDGFPSGVSLDLEQVAFEMSRRAPKKTAYSTARNEDDLPEIISGVLDNKTTGAPICAVFRNKDARSSDYSDFSDIPRPSHADYTASLRYNKNNDIRGGGHFSGRLTAPVVFAGALCRQYLKSKNVVIGAHIEEIGGLKDSRFSDMTLTFSLLDFLSKSDFP
ncbi:MAG: chorismate synthase, partial [Bacillota bacterium]|nr:chorismate synthase [Bacillota bacterium]